MGWIKAGLIAGTLLASAHQAYATEISLFEADGSAVACIDVDDEATIYLWSGQPVAYLDDYRNGVWQVFGFNGQHLGWFENGAIWMRSGDAACATEDALRSLAKLEPLKALKRLKPLKGLKQLAPLKPLSSGRFGSVACSLHLSAGRQ